MRDADVQIATEGDARRPPPRARGVAAVREPVQPPRLHPPAAVRVPRRQGAAEAQLPRGRGLAARRRPLVPRDRHAQGAGPQHAAACRGLPPALVPRPQAARRAGAPRGVGPAAGAKPQAAGGRQQHVRAAPRQRPLRRASAGARAAAPDGGGCGGSDATPRRALRRLPKLAVAVSSHSHLVLGAWCGTGAGSDAPHFERLLFDAWRRVPNRRFTAVFDAGYDSEDNHNTARRDMGVASIMPPLVGRPTEKPPTYWRRRMKRLLSTKAARRRCGYTQRWQAEMVISMVKRNLGSALRGKTANSRKARPLAESADARHHDPEARAEGRGQSRMSLLVFRSTWRSDGSCGFDVSHLAEVRARWSPR